jgi:hypothetical protein
VEILNLIKSEMTAKQIEKVPCLFNCKDMPCENTKVYRTGTPICADHLREIYGVDADYSLPQILQDHTVQTYGPYLHTSPEITHPLGTIIFGRRAVIDSILNNDETGGLINKITSKYLNNMKSDSRYPEDYKRLVAEIIRNLFEKDISLRENDRAMKKLLEARFKEVTDGISMYTPTTKIASNIQISSAGGAIPVSDLPLITQQFAIHMIPSIVNNAPRNSINFLPSTTQSNVIYTDDGFVAECKLVHRETFVLAAESKTNLQSYLTHTRVATQSDKNESSIASIVDRAGKAHPKPIDSWDNLFSGKDPTFSSCVSR